MTLKRWLEVHDVSVAEFADRTEQSKANVYLLLGGAIPQLDTLRRITRETRGLVGLDDFRPRRKKRKKRNVPAEESVGVDP